MLKNLGRLVPPRVVAAVWKTMWNVWTTQRRFGVIRHRCLLGCDRPGNEDGIEHYSRCTITRTLGAKFVGLPVTHHSCWLGNFAVLGVNRGACNDTALAKRAAVVYAGI